MIDQHEHGFTQIIATHKETIYRICRIYAVDPMEPQDLFQEVVFQIWKSFSSFNNKSRISTWIYKIAINVCYTSKNKLNKKNMKTDQPESVEYLLLDHPPDYEEIEKYQALHACISMLNEADKAIVILYLEDLPYKEIALITGLTENHIAVKMKRIRKTLFDCITHKLY